MAFQRRQLPTSQNYVTQEQYATKIQELERKLNEIQSSVNVTIEKFDFPDWSKFTSLNENQVYTFDTNGYLLVGTNGGNGNRWIETTINGRTVRWTGDGGAYKYGWGCMQVYLPIRRNIPFRFAVNHNNQTLSFAYFLGC